MPRALVALGANVGDRKESLDRATTIISAAAAGGRCAISSYHETAPVGGPSGQQPFLNAAMAFDTTLSADALLALLQATENQLGRQRVEHWGARTIDLDLLLYGDRILCTTTLKVPHPRLAFRRFVLAPAAEVAAEMVHPQIGSTIARLLDHLKSAAASYVALVGPAGSGKRELARAAAAALNGRFVADPLAEVAVAAGSDPSGRVYERQIQFLDRAAVLEGWSAVDRRTLTLSDFWFDQCLAYAELSLEGDLLAEFRRQWSARRESIVRPKLLVVLDSWDAAVAVAGGQSLARPAAGQDADTRAALLRLATRPNQVPVVYAGRGDVQNQLEEITAAITAME